MKRCDFVWKGTSATYFFAVVNVRLSRRNVSQLLRQNLKWIDCLPSSTCCIYLDHFDYIKRCASGAATRDRPIIPHVLLIVKLNSPLSRSIFIPFSLFDGPIVSSNFIFFFFFCKSPDQGTTSDPVYTETVGEIQYVERTACICCMYTVWTVVQLTSATFRKTDKKKKIKNETKRKKFRINYVRIIMWSFSARSDRRHGKLDRTNSLFASLNALLRTVGFIIILL